MVQFSKRDCVAQKPTHKLPVFGLNHVRVATFAKLTPRNTTTRTVGALNTVRYVSGKTLAEAWSGSGMGSGDTSDMSSPETF